MLTVWTRSKFLVGLWSFVLTVLPMGAAFGQFTFATDFETLDIDKWNTHITNGRGWNFDSTLTEGFNEVGKGDRIKLISTTAARSGSKCIQVTYGQNEDRAQAYVPIPQGGSDFVRTSQYVKFGATHDFAFGQKIHRLSCFDPAIDRNQWDMCVVVWGKALPGKTENDMTGTNDMYMLSINANGGNSSFDWGALWIEGISFQRDRWYQLTTELKLNDAGVANAEVRLFVDGQLAGEKRGFMVRKNQTHKVNSIMFGGWYSNGAAGLNPSIDPASPTSLLIDDVSITTQTTSGSTLRLSAIADQAIREDSATGAIPFSLTHGDGTPLGTVTVVAQSSNPALVADANLVVAGTGANRTIKATLKPNQTGSVTITLTATEGAMVGRTTLDVVVTPVADTPAITVASTTKNKPTKSGLVVTRNPADGGEVTHFKITSIQHGSLFLADGRTAVKNGTFLTFAQANAGFRFKPSTGFLGTATFDLQASTTATDAGLGGSAVQGQILVTPR